MAHRLLYHSMLGLRVIKKKKKVSPPLRNPKPDREKRVFIMFVY